jgi:hypothetical protein
MLKFNNMMDRNILFMCIRLGLVLVFLFNLIICFFKFLNSLDRILFILDLQALDANHHLLSFIILFPN